MAAALAAIFVLPGRVSEAPRVAGEIVLESVPDPGPDPFTDSVATSSASGGGSDARRATPPANPPSAAASPAASPTAAGATVVRSAVGSDPGLFGGTMRLASCDAHKLVTLLTDDTAKSRAWSAIEGIAPENIAVYVATLTSGVLRQDTRATDHRYSHGGTADFQSVLQAGTAVLIDHAGVPRVRCRSGNPLTEATAVTARATYAGSRWLGFQPSAVIVVTPAPKQIDVFVLTDLATGDRFSRPAGGDGSSDHDVMGSG